MITTRLPLAVIGSSVKESPGIALVLLREILHRRMNALEFPSGDRQFARLLGAHGQADGVVLAPQGLRRRRPRRHEHSF